MSHNRSMGRMLPQAMFREADSVGVVLLLVAQTMAYQQDEVPLLETPAMCLVDLLLVAQAEADHIDELPRVVLPRINRDLPRRRASLLVDL